MSQTAVKNSQGSSSEGAQPVRRGNQELGLIGAMWRRDMLRLRREPSRWLGIVLQPLLFWAIIGGGMSGSFTMEGASGVDYLTWFYPGVLVMIVLFTTIFATISLIEDRQSGFLQAVVVAPGSRLSLVLGKILGVTTLVVLQSMLFLALAPLAGYSLGTIDWPLTLLIVVLSSMGLTAMNFTGAWIMKSTQSYHAVMSILLLPLWVVSGAMFPPSGEILGAIMAVNPMRYSVDGLRHSLGGEITASMGVVSPVVTIGVLAAFALATIAMATWVARRRRA